MFGWNNLTDFVELLGHDLQYEDADGVNRTNFLQYDNATLVELWLHHKGLREATITLDTFIFTFDDEFFRLK